MAIFQPKAHSVCAKRRRTLRGWWLLVPFQAGLIAVLGLPATATGWQLQLVNLGTAALCAFGLSQDRRAFSLHQVYWVFTFIFLALMPALYYSLDFLPYGLVPEALLRKASLLVLGCALLFTLVQLVLGVFFQRKKITDAGPAPSGNPLSFQRWAPWMMATCALAIILILHPTNLWLQVHALRAWDEHVSNNLVRLLAQYGLRGTMLYCCVAAAFWYRRGALSGRWLAALLALAVLANFPLSLSRYLAGTFYLSVLLWLLPLCRLKPPRFSLALMALILLAAPLLNAVRIQNFTLQPGEQRDFSFLLRVSYSGDYDAYAMLCRTMQYADEQGTTNGRQLAGTLLFFVPRSAWPEKPIGSGSMVYQRLGLAVDDWSNVSCPMLGEGYVNFGIAGSLAFTLALAAFIFFYDRKFWMWRNRTQQPAYYLLLFYPVMLGLLLLWLRGDSMSAFAYSMGLFMSGAIAHGLLKGRVWPSKK